MNNQIQNQQNIETGWLEFHANVVAKDAPEIQRQEMRMAFFAGAMFLLTNVTQFGDDATADEISSHFKALTDEIDIWYLSTLQRLMSDDARRLNG